MKIDTEYPVEIREGNISLQGILGFPGHPVGLIVFAHGSGSGRFSPRNNFVARHLQGHGLGIKRCLTCGSCDLRCPQGVHFTELVRKLRELSLEELTSEIGKAKAGVLFAHLHETPTE